MFFSGAYFSLRRLSIAAVLMGALGACATPSADEQAKLLDLRYGAACSALASAAAGPKYRECVANSYKVDKQRAISQYNTDAGRTGLAALLLIR